MLRRPCPAPSRWQAVQRQHTAHSRYTQIIFAQQLTTVHSAGATSVREDDAKVKPALPVQFTRPALPCEKPLPLANVMEVQRLLYLLEAPEYCMRAFREHGVNGQDLLHLEDGDLEDSRFKFPRHVQRKVLRIAEAWRDFQQLSGGPTQGSLSLERFLDHHRQEGSHPEALFQLQTAFVALDVNSNGALSFEEFLLGYSLLEEAAAAAAHRCTDAQPAGPPAAAAAEAAAAPPSRNTAIAADAAASFSPADAAAASNGGGGSDSDIGGAAATFAAAALVGTAAAVSVGATTITLARLLPTTTAAAASSHSSLPLDSAASVGSLASSLAGWLRL